MAYFEQAVPDMKLFINVGGNLVAMGREEAALSATTVSSSRVIFPINSGKILKTKVDRSLLKQNPGYPHAQHQGPRLRISFTV